MRVKACELMLGDIFEGGRVTSIGPLSSTWPGAGSITGFISDDSFSETRHARLSDEEVEIERPDELVAVTVLLRKGEANDLATKHGVSANPTINKYVMACREALGR